MCVAINRNALMYIYDMSCKLLIYIYCLCHLCNCNHRLQNVVHNKLLTVLTFIYIIIYCLLIHDRNYHWKWFFCQVAIYNHRLDIDSLWWAGRHQSVTNKAKLHGSLRRWVKLVCVIVTYALSFLFGRDFYLK